MKQAFITLLAILSTTGFAGAQDAAKGLLTGQLFFKEESGQLWMKVEQFDSFNPLVEISDREMTLSVKGELHQLLLKLHDRRVALFGAFREEGNWRIFDVEAVEQVCLSSPLASSLFFLSNALSFAYNSEGIIRTNVESNIVASVMELRSVDPNAIDDFMLFLEATKSERADDAKRAIKRLTNDPFRK